jgi:signal transduction histidine kinase/CHASE2 domain-containing sensor protein
MAFPSATKPLVFAALLLAAGIALLGIVLKEKYSPASYDSLHSLAQLGGKNFTEDRVVIVYLDLASFLHERQNPADRWPRNFHAQLLDRLTADGARAVVFDILFDSPSENRAADEAFAAALKNNSRAILAAEHNNKNSHETSAAQNWTRTTMLRLPEKTFADAAAGWGVASLSLEQGDDFVVRRHLPEFGADHTPSLSLATARFIGATNFSGGELWVHYYGPAITIPHVSYSEVLDAGALPPNFFRDKIVFIGARPIEGFMDARRDEFRSPFHSWSNKEFFMPGVEVHATQLLNLLRGDALKRLPNAGENFLLLAVALLFGGGLLWLRPIPATIFASIGAGLALVVSLAGFSANVWFPWLVVSAVQIPAALFGSWLWQFQEWFFTRRKMEAAKRVADAKIREQAALLDKAHDAILVQSLEGEILYANPSAEKLVGWKFSEYNKSPSAPAASPSPLRGERAGVRGQSVVGEPNANSASNEQVDPSPSIPLPSEGRGKPNRASSGFSEIFSADPASAAQARAAVLRDGEWNGELKLQTRDGSLVIVASRWTLIRDESNQPSALLLINSDITEQKNLEQQFLRTQRMNTIGTLAGGMAHDLNNALSPVLLGAQLLRRKTSDEGDRKLLSLIETSANRGADMVRQVLLFARGRGGEFERVELGPLVKELEKMVRETFPKNIAVETFVPRDLWPVSGNLTQLHQVLLNLCVNARDAMPDGGKLSFVADNVELGAEELAKLKAGEHPTPNVPDATIAPSSILHPPSAKFISLLVSDTGTGMPPEVKAKIFEPFFTTKGEGKGTGIGLATVVRILKSHGGFLRVESEVGQGTTFEVFIPCAPEFSAAPPTKADDVLPRGNGELILVADDEQALCELVAAELAEFGYRVITAANGAEAVTLFKQHAAEVRLFITDNSMPVMSGPQSIAEIRKLKPGLPVIIASGEAGADIANGAQLEKPFALAELLNTVSRSLK